MGYTHYWKLGEKPSKQDFEKLSEVCKKLHDNLPETTTSAGGGYSLEPLTIKDGMGEGKPTFSDSMIDFNGDAELRLDHETFRLTPFETGFDFCKTARKPYDLLVVACLIAGSQTLKEFSFSSDGFTDYKGKKDCDDLQQGIDFYNEVIKPKKKITQNMLWKIRAKNNK